MKLTPTIDLAVIGNGHVSALLDKSGAIVWMCWPRVDGDPVFCALVDGAMPQDGYFSIRFDEDGSTYEQNYIRNTAIVRTVVTSPTAPRPSRSSISRPAFRNTAGISIRR